MQFVDIQLHRHQQMWATGGDKFDEQLRDQLTRDVRAQHKAVHGEVQEQELDVNYICQILARYSNTKK